MAISGQPQQATEAMAAYCAAGIRLASMLNNRGPIRLDANGKLVRDIVDEYLRTGFYVFENVIRPEDLSEVQDEFQYIFARLPAEPDARLDADGRPAIDAHLSGSVARWTKPLGDPFGGTSRIGGRAPVKMLEPEPAETLAAQIPYLVLGPLQFSDAALRIYGHPGLLSVAEAINGEDFAPFNEVFIAKQPGQGGSFAWHQDGTTHWGKRNCSAVTHGFNFMVQLYGSTAVNGLWYIPGSHILGKVDIQTLVREAGGNFLPEAVPLVSNPGDVAICNRQLVHASFPNTGPDWRVTLNMGFHLRDSVAGVAARGMNGVTQLYDATRIERRSEIIGYAIDARRQRFPEEAPFTYRPHQQAGQSFRWDDDARHKIRDYQLDDMLI